MLCSRCPRVEDLLNASVLQMSVQDANHWWSLAAAQSLVPKAWPENFPFPGLALISYNSDLWRYDHSLIVIIWFTAAGALTALFLLLQFLAFKATAPEWCSSCFFGLFCDGPDIFVQNANVSPDPVESSRKPEVRFGAARSSKMSFEIRATGFRDSNVIYVVFTAMPCSPSSPVESHMLTNHWCHIHRNFHMNHPRSSQ